MATARRIALALGGALLLAPAGAHASSPEALAARLASNPVFVETGAHPTLKFKQIILAPYIGDGSPVAQTVWYDDLIVATAHP